MKEIFESHSVKVLKNEISKTNIKGYSKMKKAEVVELMMKNQERFKHIKMAEKKEPKKKVKKEEPKKKIKIKKDNNLLQNMKNLVKKYNKDEIKKEKLTKENLNKYTNPYFDIAEKIEKQLEEVDDPMEFFKNNKELSKKYRDTTKNFIRRIKAQVKKK